MLELKDIECQQIVEQMQTECQTMLEEKERETDYDKAKLTRRLRDSGQENVTITEQVRHLEGEIQRLKDGKFRNIFTKRRNTTLAREIATIHHLSVEWERKIISSKN